MRYFLFLLVLLLSLSAVSALNFDNVKSYNEETKTATITNAFGLGDKIADLTLNTPQIVNVMPGQNVKVAEFTINNMEDYKNVLDEIRFYNLNNNGDEFEKLYYLKEKIITGYREIPILKKECKNKECKEYTNKINGYVQDPIIEWKDINFNDLKKGSYTVGLFLKSVHDGESGEWIPKLYGINVNEWAGWNASINESIIMYYDFNGNTDDVINYDSNLTNVGAVNDTVTFKLGNGSYNFTSDYMTNQTSHRFNDITGDFSVSMWLRPTADACSGDKTIMQKGGDAGHYAQWAIGFSSGALEIILGANYADRFTTSGSLCVADTWEHIVIVHKLAGESPDTYVYLNGVLNESGDVDHDPAANTNEFALATYGPDFFNPYYNGFIDELGIWNKSLSAEQVAQLYNSGEGIGPTAATPLTILQLAPEDNSNTTNRDVGFSCVITDGVAENLSLVVDNVTLNSTYSATFLLNVFEIQPGNHEWYCEAYSEMGAYSKGDTYSFSVDNLIINQTTGNFTDYATNDKTFFLDYYFNLNYWDYSTARLDYNGTSYPLTSTGSPSNFVTNTTINLGNINGEIPFQWIIELWNSTGNETIYLPSETTYYYSTLIDVNLTICSTDINITVLNFTFYDELTSEIVNATENITDFSVFFEYWIGTGSSKSNYTFSNLSSTADRYPFCVYSYNETPIKTDMDLSYSALGYSENNYYLRNASLTNETNEISLKLLPEGAATKFYITVQNGVNFVDSGIVSIQKYVISDGGYIPVSIKETDEAGKFAIYMDLDEKYRYIVVKDGDILGTVEKVSVCTASPCEITIFLGEGLGNIWQPYYDYYAENILSNISYDNDTEIVTYSFIDTTGLAQYFRFEVVRISLNETQEVICNNTLYASSGSLTCDMTGYEGEFIASGYISRSPEKFDKLLDFLKEIDLFSDLGIDGLFFCFGILITLVFLGAYMGQGSPSTICGFLAFGILGTKLIGLFPFSWVLVSTLEIMLIFIIYKLRV